MSPLPQTLYRTTDIRALEQSAIQNHGISGFDLMRRAGQAAFDCLTTHWPSARSLAVICGSGNNAGDGYIVAKLAHLAGLHVQVFSADPAKLKGDAKIAFEQYQSSNSHILPLPDQAIDAEVIVDALLGTGLDRPVTGTYLAAINAINASVGAKLAIDIPSGLSADTGHCLNAAIQAEVTITFIGLKQGLFSGQAADYCGEIYFDALAVPESVFFDVPPSAYRVSGKNTPKRQRTAHKGNYGHVLIIGGALGYSGAVKLAGEAALRVGAGLVSLATHPEHASVLNLDRPELMCHGICTMDQFNHLLEKATVLVLGPGLGQCEWAKRLFQTAIAAQQPIVMDADALNLLAQSPVTHPNWILTPHPGEAARLLGCSNTAIQQDRFAAALSLQAKYAGTIVLKGSGTLIASNHRLAISTPGNPGMASGGMGDVLAGVIGGLLAQGFDQQDAAEQGAYLHGLAADRAAQDSGERGLLARDVIPYLRTLLNN